MFLIVLADKRPVVDRDSNRGWYIVWLVVNLTEQLGRFIETILPEMEKSEGMIGPLVALL